MQGIDALVKSGVTVAPLEMKAWQEIADGLKKGNQAKVWDGNLKLADYEQNVIVQIAAFAKFPTLFDTFGSSETAQKQAGQLIPGAKFFYEVVPGGKLSNAADRWKWVTTSLWPAYKKYEGTAPMKARLKEYLKY